MNIFLCLVAALIGYGLMIHWFYVERTNDYESNLFDKIFKVVIIVTALIPPVFVVWLVFN